MNYYFVYFKLVLQEAVVLASGIVGFILSYFLVPLIPHFNNLNSLLIGIIILAVSFFVAICTAAVKLLENNMVLKKENDELKKNFSNININITQQEYKFDFIGKM